MPWGWLGVIPFSELPNPKSPPGYLWMLSRDGSFLYREGFWEDQNSVIPNGVGLYHVAGLLILLLRFLDRWTRSLTVPDSTRFKLGTALNNVQGRYIEDERRLASRFRSTIPSARAEASVEEELGPIRAARSDAVVNLLEEIVWQFRGEAWSRQDLVQVVNSTHLHLGPEFSFPSDEKVNPSARR